VMEPTAHQILRNRFIVGANDASKTGITTQTGPGFNVTTGDFLTLDT
jgi:hypothetical protein